MTFEKLKIIEPILKALQEEGYTVPTPIQAQSIPILLKGNDLLGAAQTGTGKTAAFAIPILQHLYLDRKKNNDRRKIKSLVVTPTRELALQIANSFTDYGKFTGIKNTVIFGGVKQGPQTRALKKGVDVLIATPGRLLDLMQQKFITLKHVECFVLDEADRMLDMGFINDIRKIIAKLPVKRQSLFFSATMPAPIIDLSNQILGDPEKVAVTPEQTTPKKVEQSVYYVSKKGKTKLLIHLLRENPMNSVLIFSRTKHGADRIVKLLERAKLSADSIHSNKSQGARQCALSNFKKGSTNILVATDIAARGIDVEGISLVINYDIPNISETYIHRIGRTGRMNASGLAWSFCNAEEKPYLRDIQNLIGHTIPVIEDHPFLSETVNNAPDTPPDKPKRQRWRSKSAKPERDDESGARQKQNRPESGKPGGNREWGTRKKRKRPGSARPGSDDERRTRKKRKRPGSARPANEGESGTRQKRQWSKSAKPENKGKSSTRQKRRKPFSLKRRSKKAV
jgi:ATP-dependent RNA helicase RhlE